MPVHYVYLFLSVLAEAAGYAALNASASFTRLWPSLLVVAGFGASFYFITLALKTLPLGIAYALASGLGIVVVALAGIVLFSQRLDPAALLGLTLIIAGIAVIHLFSRVAVH